SDKVSFLPLSRLNSLQERKDCSDIISQVINTGNFTSGPFINEIEKFLRNFYYADSCIATSSGTDAIKIALKALGITHGDEVILPLNSFAATENAVMAIGATPVFANIDSSYNMIPDEINRLVTCKTKAVLPVCLYGSTYHLHEIYKVSKESSLPIVIDAAQCFGIKDIINYGDFIALSFNPFKNIGTFGKSGAIITRNSELSKLARQYSYHGFLEGKKNIKAQNWGFNSRMDNLQAATLQCKFKHFEKNAMKRCLLAARYIFLLEELKDKVLPPKELISNTWHLFPILLKEQNRESLIQFAQSKNVELDIYYPVLSHLGKHPFSENYFNKEQFSLSEDIHSKLVHIPLHNHMSIEEQNIVIEVLYDFIQK
ncbi:UDP-4-amino-4-deoxy-L-arabinose-oxoglutarate aminotransferase, partial [Rodentibacter ratti]